MLRAHGVEVIFGLCGDTSLPLYDALRGSALRHILTRDERHAAYMADGYARVTGKVGVCEGPSGGGATYILPGLVEANESSIPVLAINTDRDSPRTAWVTIDAALHRVHDKLKCVYSTDASQVGTEVTAEARNGLAVSLTVPAAGFVIYR